MFSGCLWGVQLSLQPIISMLPDKVREQLQLTKCKSMNKQGNEVLYEAFIICVMHLCYIENNIGNVF